MTGETPPGELQVHVDPATGTPAAEAPSDDTRRGESRLQRLVRGLLLPVLAVFTAFVLGALVIVLTDETLLGLWTSDPLAAIGGSWTAILDAYGALLRGSIGDPGRLVGALAAGDWLEVRRAFGPLSETIVSATPLIFTGLSVALAFRAGLFNIGAEGQLYIGALCSVIVGFSLVGLPWFIHAPLALLAGFAGGALWGFIPGILKARTGAHEVIVTIMVNFVAYRLIDYALKTPFVQREGRNDPVSKIIEPSSELLPIIEGLRFHWGIVIALAAAVAVSWLLFRSTKGFEFRAVGLNPRAARYAGMSITWSIVLSMVIAGGLAGLAGASLMLGGSKHLTPGFSAGYGFDGIAVALIGATRPAGVVAAAFLFGALRAGATPMQAATGTPIDIVVIIQAFVIMFIAAPALVRAIYRIRTRRVLGSEVFAKGWGLVTAAATTVPSGGLTLTERRARVRQRILGIFYLLVAVIMVIGFALPTAGESSTFALNLGGTTIMLPDLVLPSSGTGFLLAAVVAFLGSIQLTRGFGARWALVLGIVAAAFVFGFLVWVAAGQSMNLTGVLQSTLQRAVPIVFGALSGVLCERAGVVNIAIEGMLLSGAFMAAVVGSATGSAWFGIGAAIASGALLAALLAVLSIRYRVDQVIAGFVINILVTGLTGFLSVRLLQVYQDELNTPERLGPIVIPLLGDIPLIGPILFRHNIFVYALYVLIIVIHLGLFYTRWGLRVRAVGEHPKAADTVGIDVLRVRYTTVILGGMVAGLGGAYFTVGSTGGFEREMSAGKGFIGLAAVIFGAWTPIGSFLAGLVFGFADAIQARLSILSIGIPSEFLLMVPYVVTVIVVAGLVGRARAPAADGKPYIKE